MFTLLGVIALVQRERRKVNIDSGPDEKVEQSDVAPVRSPDGINSCSDEIGIELNEGGSATIHSGICTDNQVDIKFPSKKDIKYICFEAYSEALSSELQDQHSEDEETYGAKSEVPEVPVPADDTPDGRIYLGDICAVRSDQVLP